MKPSGRRKGQARGSFAYAGILFKEQRGKVGAVDSINASKPHVFPVGVPAARQLQWASNRKQRG